MAIGSGSPWSLRVVAVVAMVVVAACTGAGSSPMSPSSSPSPATPTPSATPSQPPTASPAPTAQAWRVAPIPGGPRISATPLRVVTTADGFLALGPRQCRPASGSGGDPEACFGLAWTSPDGDTWTLIEPSPAIDVGTMLMTSGPEPGFVAAAGGARGTVILGYGFRDDAFSPIVWVVGPDGTIEVMPSDPAFADARWGDVVATEDGYVIVGTVVGGDMPRGAAWWSADGRTWTRVADDDTWDIGGFIDTTEVPDVGGPVAVTSTATGRVAVGAACAPEGRPCRAAIWSSADGTTWEREVVPKVVGTFHDVAVLGPDVVAIGRRCEASCAPLVMVGSPGRSWTALPKEGLPALGAIATSGDGLIGTGDSTQGETGLWSSTDGLTWSPMPDLPGPAALPGIPEVQAAEVRDVVADETTVVIVGSATVASEDEPYRGFAIVGPTDPGDGP